MSDGERRGNRLREYSSSGSSDPLYCLDAVWSFDLCYGVEVLPSHGVASSKHQGGKPVPAA